MSQPRIFVSHNHNDNAYCRDFVETLRKELGSDEAVWYDEHNLGWGKIRREIERELAQRQHFIAILSPTAVASDWVNDEIDAAIDLLRNGSMQTIQFVVALKCEMPLLLRNYKRVVAPDGHPYPPQEAAMRALTVIRPISSSPTSATLPSTTLAPQAASMPPGRFPQRLADLGFTARSSNEVEYILPPLCLVPAGPFLMGSDPNRDKHACEDELPQHTVTLPDYEIARHPVTVAEYACFVRAGRREPQPEQSGYSYMDWPYQLQRLDHPVVCVSFDDARSYANWLSYITSLPWRLPNEAEWEKAARGTDGRIFPWGDSFDEACCNTGESNINHSTPVGKYTTGVSPYGALDMAGNVWEWTGSLKLPYPYTSSGERGDVNSTGNHVLRGGAWGSTSGGAHSAYRSVDRPVDNFSCDEGFRIVRVPPRT